MMPTVNPVDHADTPDPMVRRTETGITVRRPDRFLSSEIRRYWHGDGVALRFHRHPFEKAVGFGE